MHTDLGEHEDATENKTLTTRAQTAHKGRNLKQEDRGDSIGYYTPTGFHILGSAKEQNKRPCTLSPGIYRTINHKGDTRA